MFSCSVCSKTFAFSANARRHERNSHPAASISSSSSSAQEIKVVMTPLLGGPLPPSALSATQVAVVQSSPLRASPWRCCATCGETFRTQEDRNAHARECEGALLG